jgi:hypothetical protein
MKKRNICSPNTAPDKGLLPPQYEIAHDYEGGYQCDKYYTPLASETQDEEEEESPLFGNEVLGKYSSEEDDGVSKFLDKYYSKVEIDKSPSGCSLFVCRQQRQNGEAATDRPKQNRSDCCPGQSHHSSSKPRDSVDLKSPPSQHGAPSKLGR